MESLINKLETMSQKLTDVVNEGDIEGKEYDEYYITASQLSKQVIEIILLAKEQKQMLIDAIKNLKAKENELIIRHEKAGDVADFHYHDGKLDGMSECLELIEGIL